MPTILDDGCSIRIVRTSGFHEQGTGGHIHGLRRTVGARTDAGQIDVCVMHHAGQRTDVGSIFGEISAVHGHVVLLDGAQPVLTGDLGRFQHGASSLGVAVDVRTLSGCQGGCLCRQGVQQVQQGVDLVLTGEHKALAQQQLSWLVVHVPVQRVVEADVLWTHSLRSFMSDIRYCKSLQIRTFGGRCVAGQTPGCMANRGRCHTNEGGCRDR